MNATLIDLLARRLLSSYQIKVLTDYTVETLDRMESTWHLIYPDLKLTREDVKRVWITAIHVGAYNGTLVPSEIAAPFRLQLIERMNYLATQRISELS